MAATQGQGQVRVTVHCQDNFAFKTETDLGLHDEKTTPADQGHVNEALEEDDILSPHKIDLTELNVESKLDTISLVCVYPYTFYVGLLVHENFVAFQRK
jgi:hypothetical protein